MEPVELRGRRTSSQITDHRCPERSRFGAFSFVANGVGMSKRQLQYMRVPVVVPANWQIAAFLLITGSALCCLAVGVASVCFA